jgi:arylsulfatase A
MNRFILTFLGAALCGFTSPVTLADPEKPNIILINTDDVGLGNISCYGGHFKTPNIDALAGSGTRFQYCFAPPICGPSRATCLTGRYVFRTGVLNNQMANLMDPKKEILLPTVLKPAGYATASIGKWNQLPLEPRDFGFDEYLRFPGSGVYWSDRRGGTYTQNGETKNYGKGVYLPDLMHQFAVDFMTRHKSKPFFIYYPMSHMHAQIERTPDSKPGTQEPTALYADNNAYMDKLVGKLVAAVDKLGIREKTVIIFIGDNGTANRGAKAATVDGRAIDGLKDTMLEGGSRVPLIVSWPGTTPAGKVLKDLTEFTDFMPTFAQLAGAKLPEGVKIDGQSFAPQIKGQPGSPRESIYIQYNDKRYVRSARWKLTNDGLFYDMKEAPFKEIPVPNSTKDPEAIAGREKLQATLNAIIAQDTNYAAAAEADKRLKKKQAKELKKKAQK